MRRLLAVLFGLIIATARVTAQSSAHAADVTPRAKPASPKTPAALQSNEPIATQIYSDEASFDTEKRFGIFTGHVRVFDPRFNLQSDKLTVYIHKEESEGLERAIAEGNVGVVRDKPDPNGGPPSKAVGLSEKAVYTASDGNVELTGSPRVQEGLDTHIATSPDTVMVLNQDGHLTTHGPSRTEIRQEAKDEKKDEKKDAAPNPRPGEKKKP
jgi:lipopolysaccharide transport protein LptA